MSSRLHAICFDALDPDRVGHFWAGLLGREADDQVGDGFGLVPGSANGFRLRFRATTQPKSLENRAHFDLTSDSLEHQQETVELALHLGAEHIDVGQLPEEGHTVLADPEGNEFCVLPAGNRFLEGCGFVGALACDGTQQVGYFWSEALGWPLAWDKDAETAIQSPEGGTKITWGGPPLMARPPQERVHFDLAPHETSQEAEVERLIRLGARRPEKRVTDGAVVLIDPDDNPFCVLPTR